MYLIALRVDAPPGNPLGIKEDIATRLEGLGDVRVVSVQEVVPEQLRMEG